MLFVTQLNWSYPVWMKHHRRRKTLTYYCADFTQDMRVEMCTYIYIYIIICTFWPAWSYIQSVITIGFLCSLMHAGTTSKRVQIFLPPTMLVVLLCGLHIWLLTDTQTPPASDLIVPKLMFLLPALASEWCVCERRGCCFSLCTSLWFSHVMFLFCFLNLMRSLAGWRDKPILVRFLLCVSEDSEKVSHFLYYHTMV